LPEGGEHWHFSAKLRQPRGFMDPGSFDYEGWLFFHGIDATGYITHDAMPLPGLRYPLLRLRATLRKRIAAALAGDPYAGMVIAIVTGDQSGIAEGQWQVLQATSTVHLMAIAGLHLGVVAGLLFLLVRWLWQRSARLCRRCPAVVQPQSHRSLAHCCMPVSRASCCRPNGRSSCCRDSPSWYCCVVV
jgi:competence protein ComEC